MTTSSTVEEFQVSGSRNQSPQSSRAFSLFQILRRRHSAPHRPWPLTHGRYLFRQQPSSLVSGYAVTLEWGIYAWMRLYYVRTRSKTRVFLIVYDSLLWFAATSRIGTGGLI